jgi:transposase InsO family protein
MQAGHVVISESMSDEQVLAVSDDAAADSDTPLALFAEIGKAIPHVIQTLIEINGKPVCATLDGGSQVDIMSLTDATKLGVVRDITIPKRAVKGVSGTTKPAYVSLNASLQLPNGTPVATRFWLMEEDGPILLSPATTARLRVILDYERKVLRTSSGEYPVTFSSSIVPTIRPNDSEQLLTIVNKCVSNLTYDKSVINGLQQLLFEFSDTWCQPQSGRCTTLQVSLVVRGKPKRFNPRPLSQPLLKVAHKTVDDLLKDKLIYRVDNAKWASPIVMVPKKALDGQVKWRMCCDYRYVNRLLEDDNYPIPVIHDLYARLFDKRYFSCLDLNWGFWNVRLDPESQKYTAFAVPHKGVFAWVVLPFGLKTAPTEFQHAVEKALIEPISSGNVNVYIDDIIIATSTLDEQLSTLRQTLAALRAAGLYLNLPKCQFIREEVTYLGSRISFNKVAPNPERVTAIKRCRPPTDKTTLRSFLGMAGYLRHFIPRYSTITAPLTDLLAKNKAFDWTLPCSLAFDEIKEAIATSTFLNIPDISKPYEIHTDASEEALGAALSQNGTDGQPLYLYFASKRLNPTQQRWSTGEREMFAIVWACETFERYIKGVPTTVWTDHKNLNWMSDTTSGKTLRWAIRLQEFNLRIRWKPGKENAVADYLSRPVGDDILEDTMLVPSCHFFVDADRVPKLPSVEEIADATRQENGPHTALIRWEKDVPYWHRSKRLYIPERFRPLILWWHHASPFGGHIGTNRLVRRLSRYYGWPRLPADAQRFVKSCLLCTCLRHFPMPHGRESALDSLTLFGLVSLDFIGPLKYPSNIFRYVLVAVDHYSRFMVAQVLDHTPVSGDVREFFLGRWLPYFGVPRAVLTDRGSPFVSNETRELIVDVFESALLHSSPYYPQGNGINEASHAFLHHATRTHAASRDPTTLAQAVNCAVLAYNASPHPSVGDAPFYMVFGQDMVLPSQSTHTPTIPDRVRRFALYERQCARAFRRRLDDQRLFDGGTPECPFAVGDPVVHYLPDDERNLIPHVSGVPKWSPIWSLPHRVIKLSKNTATLRPLWTYGENRQIPLTRLRKLLPTIPLALRDIIPDVLQTPTISVLQEETSDPMADVPVSEPPPAPHHRPRLPGSKKITIQPTSLLTSDLPV